VLFKLIFTVRCTRIAKRFLQRHPDMAGACVKTLALP
jgi:hypothetical protein